MKASCWRIDAMKALIGQAAVVWWLGELACRTLAGQKKLATSP
jgi:hypothetical protein